MPRETLVSGRRHRPSGGAGAGQLKVAGEAPHSLSDLGLVEHAVAEDEPQRGIRLLTELGKDLHAYAASSGFVCRGFHPGSPGRPGGHTQVQAQRSGENLDLVVEVLLERADKRLGSAGVDAAHPADVPGESSTVEEFGQRTL